MHILKTIILILLISNYVLYADYNTGFEFLYLTASNFYNYSLQYNSNRNDTEGWTSFSKHNEELFYGDLYWASGLRLNNDRSNIFIRLINKNDLKVSDIHNVGLDLETTAFFKMRMVNGPALENIPEEMPMRTRSLYYYYMTFRLKDLIINTSFPDLLTPINNFFTWVKSIVFSWRCPNEYNINCFSTYLVIGKGIDNLYKINVSGTNKYVWSESDANIDFGKYWWQIIVESNNVCVVGSEVRWFGLVEDENNVDSDYDGYTDNDEITRGSDPYDNKDIPLIISSDEICPEGYVGLQYYCVLKVNDKRYPIEWEIIGDLPEGLIQNNNIISGLPRQNGNYSFKLRTINQKGRYDEKRMHLSIKSPKESYIDYGNGSYEGHQ